MPAANKFNDYVNQKNRGVHLWQTHAFNVCLSNAAPGATNTILSDITQIAAGNGYSTNGNALTGVAMSMSGGVLTVQANQCVFTASGGAIATFRYYVLYNATQTTPLKPLVLWWDHGVAVTLNDTDTFTIKFNNATPGTIFTDS